MRIYFISCQRAALKLNGEYLGIIDSVERYVDLSDSEEVLAEIIPAGGFLPYSFFIGQSLFENPHPFLKVYLLEGGAQVCITHFEKRDRGLNILEQRALDGLNVTLFGLGGKLYLSCDGQNNSLYQLPPYFENCHLTEVSIGGFPVILAEGENCLCVISSSGNMLYSGQVKRRSTGDMLGLTEHFKTSAGYYSEREYSYNGQELKLTKNVVKKQYSVENSLSHFAFFEAVLYGGDCDEFLSEDMQGAAKAIKEYLGAYCEVTVPHKAFYDKHGDICAAALAYPIKGNLFEIKYFSVEYKDGKIDNVKALP
ncbi:MAG: hypothetical protein ACI4MQ_01015 [Candidatus Coproplasma sp.]